MDLAAVLDSMADGVFVCDAHGKLVAVNQPGLRLVGAKDLAELAEVDSLPVGALRQVDGSPFPPGCSPMGRALAGEALVQELELFDHEARGVMILRTRTAPVRGPDGTVVGAVKVATDVTREYELGRARDDFLRLAAHELKTPVTVVTSNAAAALAALDGAEPGVERLLDAVNRGADRIDRLVNSLLDLTEVQGGLPDIALLPLRVDLLLDDVLKALPPSEAGRVEVIASEPISVRADRRRLGQTVHALVDNALRYSMRPSRIQISIERRGGTMQLAVRDEGVGIPQEKWAEVFQKYFKADGDSSARAGGLGVGLFLARESVCQQGGRMWFESAEGRGSTFFVELPLYEAPAMEA